MVEAEMWQQLRVLDGKADEESVDSLVAELSQQNETDIVAFSEALAEALWRLDTEAHFNQPVRDIDDPEDEETLPLSDDAFLYLRCAVIAAGRERYEQVLFDPTALAGEWDFSEAELLLEAAPRAFEAVTGLSWDHETEFSPETGSNRNGWPTGEDQGGASSPEEEPSWLVCSLGFDEGVTPSSEEQIDEAAERLQTDPEWRAWYDTLGVEEVEILPLYTKEPSEPPKVRRGRRTIVAEFTRSPNALRRPGLTDTENAEAEIRELLQATRDALEARQPR
ncbi:DUF4240 domain-containing protein [Streptomyces griseorubiginosus]|uniref:DUF4240 domain-containing protein n=1 Tax=Streptomyces griseorubiginosus TaxID=67304 RepID=UPI00339FD4D8